MHDVLLSIAVQNFADQVLPGSLQVEGNGLGVLLRDKETSRLWLWRGSMTSVG